MEKTQTQRDLKHHTLKMEQMHADVLSRWMDLRDKLEAMTFRELSDVGFFLKWIKDITDDLRKEADKLSTLAQKLACLKWMQMDPAERGDKLVTDEYTASPDVTANATIPSRSKDPEGYDAFMAWLGVPDHLVKTELMRVHWPTLGKLITELMESGKPLPPGIDPSKTHSVFKIAYRTKRKVK